MRDYPIQSKSSAMWHKSDVFLSRAVVNCTRLDDGEKISKQNKYTETHITQGKKEVRVCT